MNKRCKISQGIDLIKNTSSSHAMHHCLTFHSNKEITRHCLSLAAVTWDLFSLKKHNNNSSVEKYKMGNGIYSKKEITVATRNYPGSFLYVISYGACFIKESDIATLAFEYPEPTPPVKLLQVHRPVGQTPEPFTPQMS